MLCHFVIYKYDAVQMSKDSVQRHTRVSQPWKFLRVWNSLFDLTSTRNGSPFVTTNTAPCNPTPVVSLSELSGQVWSISGLQKRQVWEALYDR